jgi:hypothetical protein
MDLLQRKDQKYWLKLPAQLLRRREFPLTFRRRLHNLPEFRIPAHRRQQRVGLQCLVRAIVPRYGLAQKRERNLLFAASRQQRTLVILHLGILLKQ